MSTANIPDDQLQDGTSKNKVDKNTVHLPSEDLERMPDADDDYRLPLDLPEPDEDFGGAPEDEIFDDENNLVDDDSDVSEEELELLEDAEIDTSSDESQAANLLDNEDDDGDELNEGKDDRSLFDTGQDLDRGNKVDDEDANFDEENQF
jgi:hypothetical protein